ncbi:MAG: hypothetical protein SF029_01290 [bacterium]|nr:hypothetical protein [bacterium]
MLVPDAAGTNYAVQFNGSGWDNLQFGMGLLDQITLQARFAFSDGTALIYARHSGHGYYMTSFSMEGHVEIWRVDAQSRLLLATGEAGAASMEWRYLTLSLNAGEITVFVGETIVATVTDPNPLPSGTLGFYSHPQDGGPFWMDDFALYGTFGQPSSQSAYQTPNADASTVAPLNALLGEIVYTSNQDGDHDLWTINSDGSNNALFMNTVASEEGPEWSPDATKIAFVSNLSSYYGIYLVNSDGTNLIPVFVSTNTIRRPSPVSWSPDGSRFAFTFELDLYIHNLLNSTTTKIVDYDPYGTHYGYWDQAIGQPAWHPTRNLIAYNYIYQTTRPPYLYSWISLVDTNGVERRRFRETSPCYHPGGCGTVNPNWSPSGDWLVTASYNLAWSFTEWWPVAVNNNVVVVGSQVDLTPNAGQTTPNQFGMTFSPDGQNIAHSTMFGLYKRPVECASPCTATAITSPPSSSVQRFYPDWKRLTAVCPAPDSNTSFDLPPICQITPAPTCNPLACPFQTNAAQTVTAQSPTPTVSFATNTPLGPTATPLPTGTLNPTQQVATWQALATDFPLPMNPPAPTPQARLSDLQWVDRRLTVAPGTPTPWPPLCSRDLNPTGVAASHPLISPDSGEVLVAQASATRLGNFVALSIPSSALSANIKEALIQDTSTSPTVDTLINNNIGWLILGYGHMSTISVTSPTSGNFPTVVPGMAIGTSGNSGVPTEQPHLDIAIYYVSGRFTTDVLGTPPASASTVGEYIPNQVFGFPTSVDLTYFNIWTLERSGPFNANLYGIVEVIDPLAAWPILMDAVYSVPISQIDRVCP